MNPWIWAIGALIVAVAELLMPGVYLIWFAAGAALTALVSFAVDLSLPAQLAIFVVACVFTCGVGYFVYRRLVKPLVNDAEPNQRGRDMVGLTGTIFEAVVNGRGKVKLGDSVWLADGPDLVAGTPVIVTAMRGTVVIVAPHPPHAIS